MGVHWAFINSHGVFDEVELEFHGLEDWPADQEGCGSWNNEGLSAAEVALDADRHVHCPLCFEVETGNIKALLVAVLHVVHEDVMAKDHAPSPPFWRNWSGSWWRTLLF